MKSAGTDLQLEKRKLKVLPCSLGIQRLGPWPGDSIRCLSADQLHCNPKSHLCTTNLLEILCIHSDEKRSKLAPAIPSKPELSMALWKMYVWSASWHIVVKIWNVCEESAKQIGQHLQAESENGSHEGFHALNAWRVQLCNHCMLEIGLGLGPRNPPEARPPSCLQNP